MDFGEDIERIIVAAHALTRIAALRTRSDVPAAQWRALALLEEHGPLRLGELARVARTTQPGMTRLVRDMEAASLVTRGDDPDDSRASIIALAPAGAEASARWRRELREALAPVFADLSPAQRETLAEAAAILDEHAARPADEGAQTATGVRA